MMIIDLLTKRFCHKAKDIQTLPIMQQYGKEVSV